MPGKLLNIAKNNFVWLLICLVFSSASFGQTISTELRTEPATALSDSMELRMYDSIFVRYRYSNNDSLIYLMKQGLAKFTARKYKPGIAAMFCNLGGTYSNEGMYDVAKKAVDEALKFYLVIDDKRGVANANNILGVIDGRKSNYPEAIAHFLNALKIYEEVRDTNGIADTYIKLGAANELNSDLAKSLEYYNKGLALLQDKPIADNVIFLNNNIGDIYYKKNDYLNAEKYFQKALDESSDPSFLQIHILPLENMGDLYNKMGKKEIAYNYEKEALSIAEKEHLSEERARILMSIAGVKKDTDPRKSLELLTEAMHISGRNGQKMTQSDALDSMISIYKAKNDYKDAFALLEQQKKLSDSIFTVEKEHEIASVQATYDVEKLNAKVQDLTVSGQKQKAKEETTVMISVFIATLLVVLSIYFFKTKLLNNELAMRGKKLEQASLVKNKLISMIAHDLIGSIHFMPIAVGLCKDDTVPVREKKELLGQVELSAVASYETLQNMLDWGKTQIQGVSINQVGFNVQEVSTEVVKFINIAAKYKSIKIKYDIPGDLEAFADVNHFKFVFRNLLSNAIKYTEAGGEVIVIACLSEDEKFIICSVKDNGIGISEDQKPVIFESFGDSRVGTNNEKGNGIGLNLCGEFVVQNGGHIWLESQENKGTTFYFSMKRNMPPLS